MEHGARDLKAYPITFQELAKWFGENPRIAGESCGDGPTASEEGLVLAALRSGRKRAVNFSYQTSRLADNSSRSAMVSKRYHRAPSKVPSAMIPTVRLSCTAVSPAFWGKCLIFWIKLSTELPLNSKYSGFGRAPPPNKVWKGGALWYVLWVSLYGRRVSSRRACQPEGTDRASPRWASGSSHSQSASGVDDRRASASRPWRAGAVVGDRRGGECEVGPFRKIDGVFAFFY